MENPTMQISTALFWKMYNALQDSERVLWRCDGETNPENEDLTGEISDTCDYINRVLNQCEPVVSTLKDKN